MQFSSDKLNELVNLMKEEAPEEFEDAGFKAGFDGNMEEDSDITKFFRALSVQRIHVVLTKLDGELKFKLPSCVLELELTNNNPDLH